MHLPLPNGANPLSCIPWAAIVPSMIHDNLAQSIESLAARMIAIRDSL